MNRQHTKTPAQRFSPLPRPRWLLALMFAIASGCGGGGSAEALPEAQAQPAALQPQTTVSLAQALRSLRPVENKTFLLTSTELAFVRSDAAVNAQAVAAAAPDISVITLLDWAQAKYPSRFPGKPTTQLEGTLAFRYYPTTGVFLGVAGGTVYAYGAATANTLIAAGTLPEFTCAVDPARCPVPLTMPKLPFSCLSGAITCMEVASTSPVAQASVPISLGQAFKAGAWKHRSTGLIARDQQAQTIPIQADDISSHRDGSARFAVLNARLTNLQPGERRIINLFPGSANTAPQSLPRDPTWNLEVQAKVYTPQVTKIRFGNRNGHTAGIPFMAGETIQILLSGSQTETYALTIGADQAGGAFETLTKIAEAFMAKINASSSVYLAERPGNSYEHLYIRPRDPAMGAFRVSINYAGLAPIVQSNDSTYVAPETWAFKAQDSLKAAIAKALTNTADGDRRLHGPIASEFHLSAPLRSTVSGAAHPFLTAQLDVRLFENGNKIWTDVVLENNWTFKATPRNITYELTVQQNGQVVFRQPTFTHYHHARWHKNIWSQQPPMVFVRHQMRDFLDSRAVWNYDLGVVVPESVLAAEAKQLASKLNAQSALGPMGNVFLQPDFGTTGGRAEIGPLPRWTALYLITQDQRAYSSMMANARAAGAVPIHFRNENTGLAVNTMENPNLSTYAYSSTLPISPDPTGWAPDTAHQGSFSYVPYLMTGDRFYLDELTFWATWNIFMMPSDYRYKAQSLINRQQIRGQAWALRSIAEAYRMLPDTHPMKAYFATTLQNNLDWYQTYYVAQKLGSPMGAIQYDAKSTPPWQNDFVATVLALLAENADPGASATLNWFSRTGLLLDQRRRRRCLFHPLGAVVFRQLRW
jgi:hypothetical protein